MTIEELIALVRKRRGVKPPMPNARYVKEWWPKPKIRALPPEQWGDRWMNVNSKCLHKFECFSFSATGFHAGGYRGEQTDPHLPGNVCLAYGETPEEAYNQWCSIFDVWNNKEDWVK